MDMISFAKSLLGTTSLDLSFLNAFNEDPFEKFKQLGLFNSNPGIANLPVPSNIENVFSDAARRATNTVTSTVSSTFNSLVMDIKGLIKGVSRNNLEFIGTLQPDMQAKVLKFVQLCHEKGFDFRITSAARSGDKSDELHASGIRAAKAGDSYHNYGKAVDLVTIDSKTGKDINTYDSYKQLVPLAQQCGLRWLGYTDDPYHFEDAIGNSSHEGLAWLKTHIRPIQHEIEVVQAKIKARETFFA